MKCREVPTIKTVEEFGVMNANNGIISQPSPYSVTETIDRLEADV
ncbi:MAG: hypothetical protein PUP93_03830 [Rhizonema sp. NSF051]|nr:hypothetical protein [Rhizonema sp. NSF051]